MNSSKETNRKIGEHRIDELFVGIYETETMNLENGSDLLQEELSEGEKGRILNMVNKKMGIEEFQGIEEIQGNDERIKILTNENEKRLAEKSRGKKRRILITALVAVFAFATTAFAAEIFQWDTRISSYLGIDAENSSSLSGGGMNVGVSDEKDGVTIKAVQTIGDSNNMYIIFDVTVPEGQKIEPNSRFDMVYLDIEGDPSMGYSCDMIEDENENDNKATFLLAMEANKKINNKKINVRFDDLGHYVAGSGEMISDFDSEWELEWKLDYEDISTKYQVGKELTVNDNKVKVDSVTISPIALNIAISGSYIKETDEQPREPGTGDLIELKAVTLKDGTVLTQEDASSWGCATQGDEYVLNMQMKKLLDVNQVKSVTLNDTEFQL